MRIALLSLAMWMGAAMAAAQEFVVESGKVPYEFAFEAPSAGQVTLESADWPKDFSLCLRFAEARDWAISAETREARVEAGAVRFVLAESYARPVPIAFHFKVRFTPEDDPSEPNDRFDRARTVQLGEVVTLRLFPTGEADYLRFEIEEAGYVSASLKSAEGPIVKFWMDERHSRTPWVARVDAPGEVFATVADLYVRTVKDPVQITFSFTPEDDPFEPNDSSGMAAPLETGEWELMRICPVQDEDWFSLTTDLSGVLVLDLDVEKDPLVTWGLGDSSGRMLASGKSLRVTAGDHLVRVSSSYQTSPPDPVRFQVRFIAEFDELEPNDDPSHPSVVEVDREYTVGLVHLDDRDYLELDVKSPGYLQATLAGPTPQDLVLARLSADITERPLTDPIWVSTGKLRMVLHPQYGNISELPFHLVFTVTPSEDPQEPNDTPESATSLKLGETVNLRMGPGRRDVDWFVFDVPQDDVLYVITSGDPAHPGSSVDIELFNEAGKGIKHLNQEAQATDRACPVTRGKWRLAVRSEAGPVNLRLHSTLTSSGAAAQPAEGGLDVAFIGLDADEGTMAALKALSRESGSRFRNTSNASELQAEMREVVAEATRDEPAPTVPPSPAPISASGPSGGANGVTNGRERWVWLLAGVVVLVLGVVVMRRGK